ncbi:alpha/beta hydrolase [Singulisphaera sp. Ch08]|uniref:Alpha/beta hydrolase n=1 Tax=Singulisphaera sp. Ch08 TaxID=3120278 RepID=A0AAU7C8H1_9BACT
MTVLRTLNEDFKKAKPRGPGRCLKRNYEGTSVMETGKVGRLLVAVTLFVLVAGSGLGRYGLIAQTPLAGTADPARLESTTTDLSHFDTSGHKVHFVTVEPGVQLEVLDWGGTGETLVLLAGLGNTAHVFDDFAYQFIGRYHVIGITRRGFGRSSQPAQGYDLATRASDDIKVLDSLNIRDASFVGHSIAGTELNKIGAAYPDRVKKLIYLDASDLGWGGWKELPQPPASPEPAVADLGSVQSLAAYLARTEGYRVPIAELCHQVVRDPAGKILDPITPPEVSRKIYKGLEPAEYNRIKAPALGIFFPMTAQYRHPYYVELDRTKQAEYERAIKPLAEWIGRAIQHFRDGVKGSKVVEISETCHYVFIRDEAWVVREMRRFLEK